MRLIPKESYGIIENIVATLLFSIPNLFFFFLFKDSSLMLIYSTVIFFLTISTVSHVKFGSK